METQLKNVIDFATVVKGYKKLFNVEIKSSAVNEIYMYECSQCHLTFFQPSITGDESFYSELAKNSWYHMKNKWEFEQALEDISPHDRVLEIGCGTGNFLKKLKDRGIEQVVGIDINEDALKEAKRKGIEVYKTTIEELVERENQSFDVVCSFQVLEHVPNPRSFLEASIDLLKPGGKLIIGIPNSEGFLKEIRFNLLDMPPHHLTRWNMKTILYLEKILPLRVERYSFEPIAKYHMAWYAQNKLLNCAERIFGKQIVEFLDNFIITRMLLNCFSRCLFLPMLSITGTINKIRGHTLYVKYRKVR